MLLDKGNFTSECARPGASRRSSGWMFLLNLVRLHFATSHTEQSILLGRREGKVTPLTVFAVFLIFSIEACPSLL